MEWSAFERVHGPILIHDRLEAMIAHLCAVLGGGRASDYLPRWDAATSERGQSIESMIATLESAVPKKKGQR